MRSRIRGPVLAFLALALLVAGCADDASADDPVPTTDGVETSTDGDEVESPAPDSPASSAPSEPAPVWFEQIPAPVIEEGSVALVDVGSSMSTVDGALPVDRLAEIYVVVTDLWAPADAAVVAFEQEVNAASGADRVVRAEFLVDGPSAESLQAAMVDAIAADLGLPSGEDVSVIGPRISVDGVRFEASDRTVAVGTADDGITGVRAIVTVVDFSGPLAESERIHPVSTLAADVDAIDAAADAELVSWVHTLVTGPDGPSAVTGLDQVSVQLRSTRTADEVDAAFASIGWERFADENYRSVEGSVSATAFDFDDRIDITLRRSLDYREAPPEF